MCPWISCLILVCSSLLRYVPGRFVFTNYVTLQNVLTSQLVKNELHVRFSDKVEQALFQNWAALMFCKLGQILSQCGASFLLYKAKQVVSQSRAGITKWGNYYKVEQ